VDFESAERDRRVSDVVEREQSRLRSFIRRRVADPRDVEDILQEVFSELVEANRRFMPIDHISGWLFRVARNRITDLFRKMQAEGFSSSSGRNDELLDLGAVLPSPSAGPEAIFARNAVLQELARAINELPEEERAAFIAEKRREYEEDIDVYEVASDFSIEAVIPSDELRDELIRRYEIYCRKDVPPHNRRNGVMPV
jgi:RNA polymerase sigma factor (sigma-70 family)